jgi:hypothetical protein
MEPQVFRVIADYDEWLHTNGVGSVGNKRKGGCRMKMFLAIVGAAFLLLALVVAGFA